MHYQSNKYSKSSNPYNIKNFIQNIPPTSSQEKEKDQNTISLQPKTTINSKQENYIYTDNSENTINNINPLSKSKDSKDSNTYSSLQNNLFSAVECNDLEKASNIIKSNPSQIDLLNDEGLSPLHIAVIKGNLKMINLLLKNGANANILSDKKKHTPMHLACLNQNSMTEEILQELKNFNANENIFDANNKKPSDYLNMNKKYSNENESSAEKKQVVSNTNTIMVITNENHFDSFMTSNKEEDNKSNINSTINNNTIQTPTKLDEANIN